MTVLVVGFEAALATVAVCVNVVLAFRDLRRRDPLGRELEGTDDDRATLNRHGRCDMSTARSSSPRRTDDDLAARAQAWVERTTGEQGLPVKIDNPLILRTVADILWPQDKKPDQA